MKRYRGEDEARVARDVAPIESHEAFRPRRARIEAGEEVQYQFIRPSNEEERKRTAAAMR